MFRVACIVVTAVAFGPSFAFAQGAAAVKRGQTVYAAEKCAICHAVSGKGNKKGPLDDVGAKLSADQIRQWMVNAPDMSAKTKATRKPVMKSYAHLAKDDVDALVVYLQTLKK